MQSVEVHARTVDEAVRMALSQLGRSYEEVDVEVLRPGTPGVLGVGAEDAMIRVTVRASATARQPAGGVPSPFYGTPIVPTPRPIPPIAPTVPMTAVAEVEVMASETDARARTFDPNELASIGRDVITNLLRRMRIQARPQVEFLPPEPDENGEEDSQSPVVTINLLGNDLGVLIGRRGEALTDLQYMFNLIMNKKTRTWGKIMIDVEGYRTRRKASLISLAHRMADQVMATRQPTTLEPMPAHERRLVHIALLDHPYIRSESSGEGEERKVTIFPK